MGGAVGAIENSYMQSALGRSAYERQKKIENLEDFIVGVNCFAGPHELEVMTERSVPEIYSAELITTAEKRQKENLTKLKKERINGDVSLTLKNLKEHAEDENINLMPDIIRCVECYATVQEISDVLREVFGEAKPMTT